MNLATVQLDAMMHEQALHHARQTSSRDRTSRRCVPSIPCTAGPSARASPSRLTTLSVLSMSDDSVAALHFAIAEAQGRGGVLHLVHVIDDSVLNSAWGIVFNADSFEREAASALRLTSSTKIMAPLGFASALGLGSGLAETLGSPRQRRSCPQGPRVFPRR